jgi:ribosomal protein S18 acetylase RimI-like enzyme
MDGHEHITISQARDSDTPGLERILAADDIFYANALPAIFRPCREPERRAHIAHFRQGPDRVLLVARAGAQVLGYAAAAIHRSEEAPGLAARAYVKIHNIVVDGAQRRKGIGAALARKVAEWGNKLGIADLELDVYEFNAEAKAFYKALGFSTVRTRLTMKPDCPAT